MCDPLSPSAIRENYAPDQVRRENGENGSLEVQVARRVLEQVFVHMHSVLGDSRLGDVREALRDLLQSGQVEGGVLEVKGLPVKVVLACSCYG